MSRALSATTVSVRSTRPVLKLAPRRVIHWLFWMRRVAGFGRIYLPISMDHKDPNAKLIPFVEKRMKVSGSVVEKAGLRGIAIQTVVPAN